MSTRLTRTMGDEDVAALPPRRFRPVFIEPSGRRWRVVQAVSALAFVALAAGLFLQLRPLLAAIGERRPGPDPATLVAALGRSPAVIGTGPMVRIVAVRGDTLADPFTGARLGTTTVDESTAVRSRPYVVQRYGYGGGTRRIALTFDDGPDPAWTPKILDVLARYHVHATFFVTGRAAASHPELLRRIVAEGHELGNHSISHKNLSDVPDWRARLELVGNRDLLADLAHRDVRIVRPPYDGGSEGSIADEELAIARSQRLGLAVASYDHDTHDWAYGGGSGDSAPLAGALPKTIALPSLDGRDVTVLMHDSGGDRAHSVEYLERTLIPTALRAGYSFATVSAANQGAVAGSGASVADSAADRAAAELVKVWLVYPTRATNWLFVAGVVTLAATGLGYAGLALLRRWLRRRRLRRPPSAAGTSSAEPISVSVLIAAFNEEKVIEATLRGLVASTYPVQEFIVVDDGSTDATAVVVAGLHDTLDPRIRLITQCNSRKPAALNHGLSKTTSEVVVTVDADTAAAPDMVADLVRHFAADGYGTLGAVAGVVRVGNREVNVLTRWQSLEYLSQIGIERAAQDLMNSIMIVPGACAAWRREAVLRVGGFSEDTLAEDCDLTLGLHRMGWRVLQDDDARADTEAPETVDALLKQRIRWTFGSLQAIVKHRDMLLRPRFGWLGTVLLPWSVISIVLPLLTIPFVLAITVMAFTSQGPVFLGTIYLTFTVAQAVTAFVAIRLLREPLSYLSVVPLYRAVYDPLRSYLLYRSSYLALRGTPVGWNKLARTGTVARSVAARSSDDPR